MFDFLNRELHIVKDGVWHINEIIAVTIVVIIAILLIILLVKIIGNIAEKANPRKETIFSHRKNKYKSRLGKKNKL